MTFDKWFLSAPHRAKYDKSSPAYLAASEAWEAAVAAEREACKKVCDNSTWAEDAAKAIHARREI